MTFTPGEQFPIKVGGKEVIATVDHNGILRFPNNALYRWIIDNLAPPDGFDKRYGGLNHMVEAYHRGKFTKEEYLEFYLNIGYSISGFMDLNEFQDVEMVFPLELAEHYK